MPHILVFDGCWRYPFIREIPADFFLFGRIGGFHGRTGPREGEGTALKLKPQRRRFTSDCDKFVAVWREPLDLYSLDFSRTFHIGEHHVFILEFLTGYS